MLAAYLLAARLPTIESNTVSTRHPAAAVTPVGARFLMELIILNSICRVRSALIRTSPHDDLENLLRDVVKKNFSRCFSAESPDAVSFSNASGGQVMNNSQTLVILIARRPVVTNYANSYDNSVLIPVELNPLGPHSSLLTVEFYRKGFGSNTQTNAMAFFTQSAILPDSENKELKTFIEQFLYRSVKPQQTFNGDDNIASKLYSPSVLDQVRNWFRFAVQVLQEE